MRRRRDGVPRGGSAGYGLAEFLLKPRIHMHSLHGETRKSPQPQKSGRLVSDSTPSDMLEKTGVLLRLSLHRRKPSGLKFVREGISARRPQHGSVWLAVLLPQLTLRGLPPGLPLRFVLHTETS